MEIILFILEKEKEDRDKSIVLSEDKYYEVEVMLR